MIGEVLWEPKRRPTGLSEFNSSMAEPVFTALGEKKEGKE
jgi:hypothetical protein